MATRFTNGRLACPSLNNLRGHPIHNETESLLPHEVLTGIPDFNSISPQNHTRATRHIIVESNIIRETRAPERATQHVGIYLGPQTDYITAEKNVFNDRLKRAIANESAGEHNNLQHPSGN